MKLYQDLYDDAPIAYFSVGVDGDIRKANRKAAELLGRRRDELQGCQILDFYADGPNGKEKARIVFEKFVSGQETIFEELQMKRADGAPFWINLTVKILRDAGGNIIESLSLVADITERKIAELSLKRAEERYRRFFATVDNGWVYHKVVTDENNKPVDYIFLEINEAYEKLTGLTKENIIGKRVTDVLPGIEKDPANWIERYGEVALSGKSISFENYADPFKRWYSVSATCPEKGYFIVVFSDVTERKQAEEDLLRTMKELQNANAELAQFNYVVAHDLKAPIRAMSNYSAFLEEDLAPVVSGEQKTYLTRLRQTAVETGKMIDDLLQLAKIGSQKQQAEEIELGDFMGKLVSSMNLSPDIEISMGSDWPTIMSDPLLLHQVFQNLIDNARKYNIVSPKRIAIGCLPETDESITCYVRDSGIGIAAEYREQIFGLFERLHSPKEYGGTGVGLAMVKKAVNKLGGTIRVESTVGKGSTFYVSLPVDTTG